MIVKIAAIEKSGQLINDGQFLQFFLRDFLVCLIPDGFNDGNQLAIVIVDWTCVSGQVKPFADAWHDAPVFRFVTISIH